MDSMAHSTPIKISSAISPPSKRGIDLMSPLLISQVLYIKVLKRPVLVTADATA